MLLVFGSDDRYALPLCVAAFSALRRIDRRTEVRLAIVDAGISEQSRTRIARVVKQVRPSTDIEWIPADISRLSHLRNIQWGSPATFIPLLLPTLLPEDDHLICIDCDVLVQRDLSDLWALTQQTDRVALRAVVDYGFPTLGEAFKDDACAILQLGPDAPYFNSGVMVISLSRWRDERIAERAFSFAADRAEFMRFGGDQDALNGVLQGDFEILEPDWNVLVGGIHGFVEYAAEDERTRSKLRERLTKSPGVLHFSGPQKPWRPGYSGLGKQRYRSELIASGWFEKPIERTGWMLRQLVFFPWVRARRALIGYLWQLARTVRNARSEQRPARS